ncbi:MAG: SM-20-related protein [Candidatus Midichloriaceae bacterium]|jgi:SM-20-related protein
MYINYESIINATLNKEPFKHFIIKDFINKDRVKALSKEFPDIKTSGSIALSSLIYQIKFEKFIKEIKSHRFKELISKKFEIDLSGHPLTIAARGMCRKGNGKIHVDLKSNALTLLIYFNDDWDSDGGKLRLLNNENDMDDYLEEIEPLTGTLVAFECVGNAWHGHKPHIGVRKSMQLNYVKDDGYLNKEQSRHKFSTLVKKLCN